jgi:hypothetical protein
MKKIIDDDDDDDDLMPPTTEITGISPLPASISWSSESTLLTTPPSMTPPPSMTASTRMEVQPGMSPAALASGHLLARAGSSKDPSGSQLLRALPFPSLSLQEFCQNDNSDNSNSNCNSEPTTIHTMVGDSKIARFLSPIKNGNPYDFTNSSQTKTKQSETADEMYSSSTTSSNFSVPSKRLNAVYNDLELDEEGTHPTDDMFSFGCILAQLYLPKNAPLFTQSSLKCFTELCNSKDNIAHSDSGSEDDKRNNMGENHSIVARSTECLIKACGTDVQVMPVSILETVAMLVQPNRSLRPSASTLLGGGSSSSGGGGINDKIDTSRRLFPNPSRFYQIYNFLSEWYSCSSWEQRFLHGWKMLPSLIDTASQ